MIHPFVIWKGKLISFSNYKKIEHNAKERLVRLAKAALARGEGYY